LLEALKARDESAVTAYLESNPSAGELLLAGILFISHQTPYSHIISPGLIDLLKKYSSPDNIISTVERFWELRPSTATVLVLKYVDWGMVSLVDVVSWLFDQDTWMRKAWGWEIMQQVHEKAVAQSIMTKGDVAEKDGMVMEVDENVPRQIIETVVAKVNGCFERQSERDKEWLKEWFDMVVGLFLSEVDGLEGVGWVRERLSRAQEYKLRLT
jgi:ATP-dependent Clp protease adapter protein ClpS